MTPSLFIKNKPCFEINLLRASKELKLQVQDAYRHMAVPFELWSMVDVTEIAAIPCDLVEQVSGEGR